MSVLVLVRHGQASFFAPEYDQLSTVGEDQARLLGEYWIQRNEIFDEIYVGPRIRQQETANIVARQFEILGLPWPRPTIIPELDEYDLNGLLTQLAPALAQENATFRELLTVLDEQAADDHDHIVRFQRMFEMLLAHWQTMPTTTEMVESWVTFHARVQHGLRRITDLPGKGRHIAVFSSGGFIGTATALALMAPARTALELNWRLRNSSLTRLLFSSGRLTLDEFNSVSHLADSRLWTYR
jgi:broad specificity phosphatase PhoE